MDYHSVVLVSVAHQETILAIATAPIAVHSTATSVVRLHRQARLEKHDSTRVSENFFYKSPEN